MNLKNMTKEEIETLSYADLTCILLTENKKPMTTAEIFKKICELLEYTDSDYAEKIGDYYTSLTIDKRFVMLEEAKWDLRKNHAVQITIDDEDEEEELEEEPEETIEQDIEDEDETESPVDDEEIDIDDDDDLEDLSVFSESELEEN